MKALEANLSGQIAEAIASQKANQVAQFAPEDLERLEDFRSKALQYLEEQAQGHLYLIQMPPEADIENAQDQLGKKMDAIAWITQAMPLLDDKSLVQDALDSFRAVEVPRESSLLVRYYTQKTPSAAILAAVNSLHRYCSDSSQSDPSPIVMHLQAIELLIGNNVQA